MIPYIPIKASQPIERLTIKYRNDQGKQCEVSVSPKNEMEVKDLTKAFMKYEEFQRKMEK